MQQHEVRKDHPQTLGGQRPDPIEGMHDESSHPLPTCGWCRMPHSPECIADYYTDGGQGGCICGADGDA